MQSQLATAVVNKPKEQTLSDVEAAFHQCTERLHQLTNQLESCSDSLKGGQPRDAGAEAEPKVAGQIGILLQTARINMEQLNRLERTVSEIQLALG